MIGNQHAICQYLEELKQRILCPHTPPKTRCLQKTIYSNLSEEDEQRDDGMTPGGKMALIARIAKTLANTGSATLSAVDSSEEWDSFTDEYLALALALDAVPTLSDLSALTGHGFAGTMLSTSTAPAIQRARREVMAVAEGLLTARMDEGKQSVPFTIFQLKARHGWNDQQPVLLLTNKEAPKSLEELTRKYIPVQDGTQKDTKE